MFNASAMTRAFSAVAGLSMAAVLVSGAAWAQANPSNGKRVAYFQNSPNNPYTTRMKDAFIERAKSYGMDVTVFATPFDPALQAQQIDDALAQRFDLLTVMPASESAIVPPLMRVRQAKLPVIIVNTEMKAGTESLYDAFVGERSADMGKLAGEAMAQVLEASGRKDGKIALLTGPLTEAVVGRRVDAIKQALAKYPGYKIVAVEDVKWDMANAERVAGQLYARFAPQGGIDIIYGMADNVAIGAIRAAEAASIPFGTKKGELVVMGGACQPPGIPMLRAGKIYATGVQVPQRTGRIAADLANDYFNGKKLERDHVQPVATVTRANLAEWEERCTWK